MASFLTQDLLKILDEIWQIFVFRELPSFQEPLGGGQAAGEARAYPLPNHIFHKSCGSGTASQGISKIFRRLICPIEINRCSQREPLEHREAFRFAGPNV